VVAPLALVEHQVAEATGHANRWPEAVWKRSRGTAAFRAREANQQNSECARFPGVQRAIVPPRFLMFASTFSGASSRYHASVMVLTLGVSGLYQ
jgi:hypothetical protein